MLMERWLANQSYYRSQYVPAHADNPDQRIQQDVESFVSSSLALSMGLLNSVVSLFSFSIILWSLSGTLVLFGWKIPRAMVFIVYLYVIVSTVFAVRIGRPLIRLNFLNEQFSANFRYALIRLREYGESIAFYRGEAVEGNNLVLRLSKVIHNSWAILFRSLKFQGFNFAVSQAAVVFPFIVQAPRLLSRQITLGDVMQTAQSFGQVESALSFFRTSYDDFAGYRAVVNRLSGFLDLTEAAERLGSVRTQSDERRVAVTSLTVRSAANIALVTDLTLELPPTSSLLIRGASGVGKTTLLRAIAGLWPYADGTIVRPIDQQSQPRAFTGLYLLRLSEPSIIAVSIQFAQVQSTQIDSGRNGRVRGIAPPMRHQALFVCDERSYGQSACFHKRRDLCNACARGVCTAHLSGDRDRRRALLGRGVHGQSCAVPPDLRV